jgi:hypothetical protein
MAASAIRQGSGSAASPLDLTKAKLIDLQVTFDAQPLPIAFGEITWASVDLTYSASGVGAEMTVRVPIEWDGNASDDAKRDLALRRARDLLDHACNAPAWPAPHPQKYHPPTLPVRWKGWRRNLVLASRPPARRTAVDQSARTILSGELIGWQTVWSETDGTKPMTRPTMAEYEIRILGSDGRPNLISEWVHLNLTAAITSAKRMSNGAAFEVWLGGTRVHASKGDLTRIFMNRGPRAA